MKYSVWNYDTKRYDYYQSAGASGTHAGTPPRARGPKSDLGATPDQAAWPLPSGAQKVGSGASPQGRIASLGDTSDSGTPGSLALIAGAGVALWYFFVHKKGR